MLFFEECDYWQINPHNTSKIFNNILEKEIKFMNLCFDNDWCAGTLKLEKKNCLIEKNNYQHGIVFTKINLNNNFNYIEFKVNMKIPSTGTSHLFIGILDKSKYEKEFLSKIKIK